MINFREIRHFHFCCGIGGAAKGFNKANPRVGNMQGRFRCIGGVDVDASAIRDFDRIAGVPGTVMDLFTREQYIAFHSKEPPAGWREMGPADIRRAAGNERPHVVFISSPCKGASGLLSEKMSLTAKYQALNQLTLRCIWLMSEAWADDPVDLIVFENVPRLATRGRHLLDQINQVLRGYGYAVAETTHDCGELGGLAQSRKRFLLVARHMDKVPAFLYEPEKKRLQAVGTVLGRMPLPGDLRGGPMHRIPRLQWKTWVRLAFVEAGSDWRSLNKLAVENGHLSDYLIVPDMHNGTLGVRNWNEPSGVVTGNARPATGSFSIADPRFDSGKYDCGQYGLCGWHQSMGAVINVKSPGQGTFAVQDPRPPQGPLFGKYAVTPWNSKTGTVIGGDDSGAYAVADPRGASFPGKYKIVPFNGTAPCVIAGSTTGQGAFAVADPRTSMDRSKGDNYLTGGHYGVVPWESSSGSVSSAACHDNGRWSVADPRYDGQEGAPVTTEGDKRGEYHRPSLPSPHEKTIAMIRSLDGTWHRPFTTLELAALQSLIDPEEYLELDGKSDSVWREHIGNLVPPDAAEAIAGVMGTTLLLTWSGETFVLSSMPIWVQPIAIALTVAQGEPA